MQCSRTGHEMPTFPQIPHQDPAAAWRWGSSGLLRGSNVMMKSERVMHLGKVWFVLQIVESKSRHIQYTKLTPNISIEERGAQGWTGGLVVFLSCALCLFAHPGKSSHWRRVWTQLHTFDLFAWLALFVRVLNNIFRYIQPLWSYISHILMYFNSDAEDRDVVSWLMGWFASVLELWRKAAAPKWSTVLRKYSHSKHQRWACVIFCLLVLSNNNVIWSDAKLCVDRAVAKLSTCKGKIMLKAEKEAV